MIKKNSKVITPEGTGVVQEIMNKKVKVQMTNLVPLDGGGYGFSGEIRVFANKKVKLCA